MAFVLEFIQFIKYYILPFVVVLGVMIFFHELGHFLVAKYFNVKVLKFALGFGPVLVGKTVGETEYSIRYFPLGGFVKMLGEEFESEEEPPEMTPQDLERSFSRQHPLKRMAIVAAGPLFNLVLALLMFCGSYFVSGMTIILPEVGQVTPDSPADRASVLKGDVITEINGKPINRWSEIKGVVADKTDVPLNLTVQRGEKSVHLTVTPKLMKVKNAFGEEVESPLIGIVASGQAKNIALGPLRAIKAGVEETYRWIHMTFLVIWKLLQGDIAIKTLGGPIMIGQMTGQIAQEDISYLMPFTAIISINLGIINLFPIPILDGGLLIFLLMELIIGKPLSVKKRELAIKIGLTLLILLMLTVTYNDIARIVEQLLGK